MRTFFLLTGLLCALCAAAQKPETGALCRQKHAKNAIPQLQSADPRSDSMDLLRIDLALRLDFDAKRLQDARADIACTPLLPNQPSVRFDLLQMQVDTVFWNLAGALNWQYDGQALQINFPQALQPGDTAVVSIQYGGQPVQDASGWGGFYWQGAFAYNLGVGFDADPHNFGRAWFPCFDNFQERFAFQLRAATPPDRPAFGNGRLTLDSLDEAAGLRIRQWEIQEPTPSYLLCVAAGPFATVERTYPGESGLVPVQIAVVPADSAKLLASFTNLPDALTCFEHWYGPYRWNKIGYSIVPFNSGAMEHATNIAYMSAAVNGNTDFETLMAHELSHHWWGNLATCATAEDMWLNEGWASFSELLFTEWIYGREAYLKALQTLFLDVLRNTHVDEGGYRAVSGLPHNLTYGSTVYDKGALIPHNLRAYLGDSLFRTGIRTAMTQYQFADWSSAQLRDALTDATGIDLDDFFDDWVFQPGFSHFAADSFQIQPIPNADSLAVRVFLKQKRRGATHFYKNVPLECTFVGADWQKIHRTAWVSGETDTATFILPAEAEPIWVWTNTRGGLTLARGDQERILKLPIAYSFAQALMNVNVTEITDSALLRVEHNWVMPDTAGANPDGYALSNRYWRVEGNFPTGFSAIATLFYDGRGQLDQLDTELFAQNGPSEDNVRLLYRPGPGHPWLEHPMYLKNTLGSPVDRYGLLRIDALLPGEYTVGKSAPSSSVETTATQQPIARIAPNPVASVASVSSEFPVEHARITDTQGRLAGYWNIEGQTMFDLPVNNLSPGLYWLTLTDENGRAYTLTLMRE
ncbi:MAG: hypothetical protein RL742_1587 [Bacteroidota bacterium]|jgi:aminopeptidase N